MINDIIRGTQTLSPDYFRKENITVKLLLVINYYMNTQLCKLKASELKKKWLQAEKKSKEQSENAIH